MEMSERICPRHVPRAVGSIEMEIIDRENSGGDEQYKKNENR